MVIALAQDALPSPTLLAWRPRGDWMGDSAAEVQLRGPDPSRASLRVLPRLLCRDQGLEPPGSNQRETARHLQTCQGWCETLPSLGIRGMGMGRGGPVCEKNLFCSFAHVSPGVGMDSPSSLLCCEGGVLFEHWLDSFSGRDCSNTRVVSAHNTSATGVLGGKPQTGVGTFPGLESVKKTNIFRQKLHVMGGR